MQPLKYFYFDEGRAGHYADTPSNFSSFKSRRNFIRAL